MRQIEFVLIFGASLFLMIYFRDWISDAFDALLDFVFLQMLPLGVAIIIALAIALLCVRYL